MATKLVRQCRYCQNHFLGSSVHQLTPRLNFNAFSKNNAKSPKEIKEEDIRADVDMPAKRSVKDYTATELQELCDVSRLPRQLKAKLAHRDELMPPIDKNAASIEKQRLLYARLGEKSGLPPGIMWPSKSQVKFAVEDEKTYFATIQEMIRVVKDKEAQEKEERQKEQEEITRAMKDMPSLMAEFEGKLKKKREAEQEAMKKNSEMLQEARDFFGYAIQENDDRIVKFLEQKEAAEKERAKEESKALRKAEQKKQLEELARKATEEALKMAAKDVEEREQERIAAETPPATGLTVEEVVREVDDRVESEENKS